MTLVSATTTVVRAVASASERTNIDKQPPKVKKKTCVHRLNVVGVPAPLDPKPPGHVAEPLVDRKEPLHELPALAEALPLPVQSTRPGSLVGDVPMPPTVAAPVHCAVRNETLVQTGLDTAVAVAQIVSARSQRV